jgi:hypothetical protein
LRVGCLEGEANAVSSGVDDLEYGGECNFISKIMI